MIWNVFYHDFNGRKIKVWNVFNHGSFCRDVEEELLRDDSVYKTYEEFSERLRRVSQYYFWSRSEYEVVLTSWTSRIDNKELDRLNKRREEYPHHLSHSVNLEVGEKVDIHDQLELNWDAFAKYVWSFKKN